MRGFTDEVAPHQIAFEAYGVTARVCVSSEQLLARVEPLLPPGWRHPESPTSSTAHRLGIVEEDNGTYSVYNGGTRVNERGALDLALVVLDGQVRSYVAVNAPGMVFVHAGVVVHNGEAIVIPGHSFSGKTTLVAALVRRGAIYYSDEFAVFDERGLIHPYPKPLSLRPFPSTNGFPEGPQTETTVESLGGVAGSGAASMRLAVVTHYVPGAEWRPRRLSRGEAALALLSKAVPARYRPEDTLKFLSLAVDGVTVLEGDRGDAEQFADTLLDTARAAA